ncbi:hypothetical protein ABZZ20_02180 [Streptomyces sp. NPDC006430]|uniref:hypothetical protein n=1 Tax=Streptomyces sp. NPDC006430 TaxID=3154299 RepID=UPI0033A4673B
MQLRRAAMPLPLILAALTLSAGCVTVRPHGPVEQARPGPAADRTSAREAAAGALPLGPLPASADPSPPAAAEPDHGEPPELPGAPTAQRSAEDRRHRRTGAAEPARPAHPAPAPKSRKRPPVQPWPQPAPQPAYDMTALCEAAKGTVPPSIAALCR